MQLGDREVSIYEIIHGGRARWWWDRRYIPEAETDNREPLSEDLMVAIEMALDARVTRKEGIASFCSP